VLKAFTPRAIAALEPRIREISLSLLQPALAKGEFDLIGEFAGPAAGAGHRRGAGHPRP
jgi:cytochrome P450